jgi:predicted RNA methylase
MDRQAREEFRASLSDDPPEPTPETIAATLRHFIGESPMIFSRGIANAFSKLDRRFRSHDGFKIGARVILDRYVSEYGSITCRGEETLRDVERVFMVLDGLDHPEAAAGIVGAIRHGAGYREPRPCVIESDWVRVRIFKNGNAHLWFTKPDLVRKVNRLLADYYGEAIGEGSDVADVSDMRPGYHLTPARNLGFFETSPETAESLLDRANLPWMTREKGSPLRVLEPSAGNGALADIVRAGGADVQCIEVDTGRAAVLRKKGHAVMERDFLAVQPHEIRGGLFDLVVMNPPFDRGRDCDHVRHALQFLKPGGCLVAIMAAGTEYAEDSRRQAFRAHLAKVCKDPGRWHSDGWFRDLPEGSFSHAGTMVNTVTLCVRKKEA